MPSTTKYQPAPREEPDNDYTHAPPAYAEGSASRIDDEPLLGGAPRSSEDNVPDDFKVRYGLCSAIRHSAGAGRPVTKTRC